MSVNDLLLATLGSIIHRLKGQCVTLGEPILKEGIFISPLPETPADGFLHQKLWVVDIGSKCYVFSLGDATGSNTSQIFTCELIVITDARRATNQEMISLAIRNSRGGFRCTILLGYNNGGLLIPKDGYYHQVANDHHLSDFPEEYLERIKDQAAENESPGRPQPCRLLYRPPAVRHLMQNLLDIFQNAP